MGHFSLWVLGGGFPEKMDARLQLAGITAVHLGSGISLDFGEVISAPNVETCPPGRRDRLQHVGEGRAVQTEVWGRASGFLRGCGWAQILRGTLASGVIV